jgi:cysteinyl-tRNA synthetase
VLGLSFESEKKSIPHQIITDSIKKLLEERVQARKNHNWAEADRLRDELLTKYNYVVVDNKID